MTTRSQHEFTCRGCGCTFSLTSYDIIDVGTDPDLKASVISGDLFVGTCPKCGSRALPTHPLVYMDPGEKLLVILSTAPMAADDVQGYTARRVERVGDLIEKVKIHDAGLSDLAIEMCKYVTAQELGREVCLKFLKLDGADNDLIFAYPSKEKMEMLSVGFNVYEDCHAIIGRNPQMEDRARGLTKVDQDWIGAFFR